MVSYLILKLGLRKIMEADKKPSLRRRLMSGPDLWEPTGSL